MNRKATRTAAVGIRMRSKSRLWRDRWHHNQSAGVAGNSYFTGGRSGLSATCGPSGPAAGRRRNWCRRTAASGRRVRRAHPSSACRKPGTPSGPDRTLASGFPSRWQSTSAATAISRRLRKVACACRRFLTPRPRVTQLEAVMCVMEQVFYQSLAQRVRVIAEGPIRSPNVVCWISPSGTMPRAALGEPEQLNDHCRFRAPRRRLPFFPDRARPD
ncbi:hypothetical protein Bra1253DRAFT_07162 [Bradyrhizobium sp. WSM1253]|nr:hypothetical protein Bra1253DRAFT_07162 [Bradyrhizobium sp. WSM1253]